MQGGSYSDSELLVGEEFGQDIGGEPYSYGLSYLHAQQMDLRFSGEI